MAPEPQHDPFRETTNPGFRPPWADRDATIDERTRLPLGLVVSLLALAAGGMIQAGIAWSKIGDHDTRIERLEVTSQERSLKQQHLEDELVHIREAVERTDSNVRDLKTDFRGRR